MGIESQSKRIERLGNPDGVWQGQSHFDEIYYYPTNEWATVPNGFARLNICAKCGLPFKDGLNEGALQYAVTVIVLHKSPEAFAVYHKACADQTIPFAGEVRNQSPKWHSDGSYQPSLWDSLAKAP